MIRKCNQNKMVRVIISEIISLSMQKGLSDAEIQAVSNKFLEVIKELETVKNWQEIQDKPVRVAKIQRGERLVTRSEITVNLPFETVANFFNDPTFMKKITDRLANIQVLYKTGGLTVVHIHMKGFAMISDREMVVVFTFHREGNKIYFGNRSCEYPCKPFEDTVRAFSHCGGTVLEKVGENSTRIINLTDVDMNGSMPGFVKNKAAVMRAASLAEIEEKIKASLK